METTDILSNPAALHSLKRAQLVQLCKLHKIKASGKNSELISRLKRHANNLPPDTPLKAAGRGESSDCGDIAAESEGVTEDESDGDFSPITNWTIVMPSIPEEEHNGHGSIESKTTLGISSQNGGDFGTSGSSRCMSWFLIVSLSPQIQLEIFFVLYLIVFFHSYAYEVICELNRVETQYLRYLQHRNPNKHGKRGLLGPHKTHRQP